MAIKMVRQPSDTPNINNIDDIVGLRYAYGNQDGYVIGKGNELGYSVDGSNFKVLSGRVVLQGVESDVDANGVTLTVDNVSELRYYTVYYQVNMATNETNILLSNYDTATYPVIEKGSDLTADTIGIANLELYHFQAQNGIINGVQKLVKAIEYSGTALVGFNIQKGTVEERFKPLDNYDNGKGTIEERLTKLGFKEGVVEFKEIPEGIEIIRNSLKKQGKYVLAMIGIRCKKSISTTIEGTLPEIFSPGHQGWGSYGDLWESIDSTNAYGLCSLAGGTTIDRGQIIFIVKNNGSKDANLEFGIMGWETD